jgi:hypothetical protein
MSQRFLGELGGVGGCGGDGVSRLRVCIKVTCLEGDEGGEGDEESDFGLLVNSND